MKNPATTVVVCVVCCVVFLVVQLLLISPSSQPNPPLSLSPPCFTYDMPKLLILVDTYSTISTTTRAAFRNTPFKHTWHSCAGAKIPITWRFTLESSSSSWYLPLELYQENEQFGDMILDRYQYTSTKLRLRLYEEIVRGYDFDYLVKITDQTLLSPEKLLNHFPASVHSKYYGGHLREESMIVYSDPNLIVMSRALLLDMLVAMRYVAPPNNEALCFGLISKKLGVVPQSVGRGFELSEFRQKCSNPNITYFTDVGPPSNIERGYNNLMKHGRFC